MSKRSAQRHRQERREREGERHLDTMEVKALDQVAEIVERKVGADESRQPRFTEPSSVFTSVYRWALTSMANEPASRSTPRIWDTWYRAIAKREPFLVGVLNSAVQIDQNRGWTLEGGRNQVARYTRIMHDIDNGAGWRPYISWQAQAYYTTQMGAVSEIGRQGRGGPMVNLWSVDPCRCEMSGNPEKPLNYYPKQGGKQEWTPDLFFRGKSLVSTDEDAIDYGFPAIARCYELAKVMIGVYAHYQAKVGTRTPDAILTGKYISQSQWEEALKARNEALNTSIDTYLNSIATIMSSGGDMPEFILTSLSSLPDRWDIDIWTQILMRGYALAFGYQSSEFYPENAGVMGRGKEQEIQHESATGKGGKDFSLTHQELLQRQLPPTLEFQYDERDTSGEAEDAALQLAKAQVITALSALTEKSGGIEQSRLTTEQILELAAEQGLVPEDWTPGAEDVTATDEEDAETESEEISERVYRACQCFPNEPIVRYSWPSGKTRTLYRYGADRFTKRITFNMPIKRMALPAKEPERVIPNFTVNMPAQAAPIVHMPPTTVNVAPATVNAIMPTQERLEPPVVNVNVPQQAAPNVNVEPPVVNVAAPVVNMAAPIVNVPKQERQETPIVNVNVPQQAAPVVNVAQPVVNVAPSAPVPVTLTVSNKTSVVKRDPKGRITEIDNTPDVQVT